MKTRDYYTPENADELDAWRESAPEGRERLTIVHVSSTVGLPVSVNLIEGDAPVRCGTEGDRRGWGYGHDFAEALSIAVRRFAGEAIDCFGDPDPEERRALESAISTERAAHDNGRAAE